MAPIDKALLEKYMRGECSPGEESLVHQWLDENDMEDYPDVHKEKKYEQKIQAGWLNLSKYFGELKIASSARRIPMLKQAWAIAAASVLMIMLAGYLYYRPYMSYEKRYQTTYGEIKSINLDDGTTVTLNARSTLEIRKGFNKKDRQVFLQGEAYFNIKHRPDVPFVVHAGRLAVTALGTAFDVTAFSDDPGIAVSLKEGKVLVQEEKSLRERAGDVVLAPGDEAVYTKSTHTLRVDKFDPKERLDWRQQVIYFENADIGEALNKLERFYGVSFDTHLLKPRHWQLTGEYRNETLHDVLESLSFNYNLKYRIEGEKVILYEP